jgi:hypothetical protein
MNFIKIFLTLWLVVLLTVSFVFGTSLNLKATWDLNNEPDMAGYKLYRTDGVRILLGTIPHPPTLPYPFIVTLPDGSSGILTFVLTAFDTYGNESLDSVTFSYPFNLGDLIAPIAPRNLRITN